VARCIVRIDLGCSRRSRQANLRILTVAIEVKLQLQLLVINIIIVF
jgi:hypothetical protein